MLADNQKYTLMHDKLPDLVIPEPLNYRKGQGNTYSRDEKFKGYLRTKNEDLQLHGKEAYDFLLSVAEVYGLSEVKLKKEIKDPYRLDELLREAWTNFVDIGECTFDLDKQTIKTKFREGGLLGLVKSKESSEFNLKKTESINGVDIGTLETVTVSYLTRRILQRSLNKIAFDTDKDYQEITTNFSAIDKQIYTYRQNNVYSSDNNFRTPFDAGYAPEFNSFSGGFADSNALYVNDNTTRTLTVEFEIDFMVTNDLSQFYRLVTEIYKDNGDGSYTDQNKNIERYDYKANQSVNERKKTKTVFNITLESDEMLVVGMEVGNFNGNTNFVSRGYELNARIIENSEFPPSEGKALTRLQAANRLVALITGKKDRVRSDLLENGKFKDDLITDGYWVRQFPDIINEGTDEERLIQFRTSFKDFREDLESELPIAIWSELIDGEEYIRIEAKEDTQRNDITIPYKEFPDDKQAEYLSPNNLELIIMKGMYYSELKFGSKKGGEGYEEVFGLNSFAGNADYETINAPEEPVTYERLSNYAHGDIDIELPRRKPFEDFPDTDTKYDSIITVIKAKKVGDKYTPKLWQDIYEEAPTGVYDVESAYNFELAPGHLLRNHSYNFSPGLVHEKGGEIFFAGSNCNSSLSTKKAGEAVISQEKNIPHSELDDPRVLPFKRRFSLPVSQALEDKIASDNNSHGLVEVKIKGDIQYFRIVEVDTNDVGKHELIKAYING